MKCPRVVLLVLAFLLTGWLLPAQAQRAPTIRIPKVISIVYDDSGSMTRNFDEEPPFNSDYANYAVKLFVSLLNPEDAVYLTFMSDPGQAIRLDLRTNPVTLFQNLDHLMGRSTTPIRSVDTAANAMRTHAGASKNSEFWLVVFTDGYFTSDDGMELAEMNALENLLLDVLKKPMPNKTSAKVGFISIGEDAARPDISHQNLILYPQDGRYIKQPRDIVPVMQQLADKVSGRASISKDKIISDGNTVRFTTDLPSFSIGLLLQDADKPWLQMIGPDGLAVVGSKVEAYAKDFPEIRGYTGVFRNDKTGVLPAGSYQLVFSAPPKDLVILTEPALVLDLSAVDAASGQGDDFSLMTASRADVQAVLRVYGENRAVDPALLPRNTEYLLQVTQGDVELAATKSPQMTLEGLAFAGQPTLISGQVYLPGIGGVQASRSIQLPRYSLQVKEEKTTFSLRELVGNRQGLRVEVLVDGQKATAEQAAVTKLEAYCALPMVLEETGPGSYLVFPVLPSLQPLAQYGSQPLELFLKIGDKQLAGHSQAWQVTEPKIRIDARFLGTDSMVRTRLRHSAGLLKPGISLADLEEPARTQVIANVQVLLDGQPLHGSELAAWGSLHLKLAGSAENRLQLASLFMPDGSVLAAPYYQGVLPDIALLAWLDSWTAWQGRSEIEISLEELASASLAFSVTLEPWWLLLLRIFLPILLLLLLIGYLSKRRFCKGATLSFADITASGDMLVNIQPFEAEKLRRFNLGSLLPFVRSWAQVGGLRVYAGDKAFVLVKRKQLPASSALIGNKQCMLHGRLQADATNTSAWRELGDLPEGEKGSRFAVLAQGDVLLASGDRRSGRAYQYKQP